MIHLLVSFILTVFGIAALAAQNVSMIKFATFLLWANNVIFALKNTKKHIAFLLFNITFFTFLLGKPFAAIFATAPTLKEDLISDFALSTQLHIYTCLLISLVTLLWSYYCFYPKTNTIRSTIYKNEPLIVVYRKFTSKLSYFFFVFALLVNIEKIIFVFSVGYIEYYTEYHTHLPIIIHKLANFYNLCFYFYLVTMPTKKEARIPIILYLLLGLSSLGYGQRNGLMLNMIMMVLYFFIREKLQIYGSNEHWITKKLKVYTYITIPFLLIFLMAFNDIRNNQEFSSAGTLWNNFLAFFHQQGISVSLIGYEKELHNLFPQEFPYSLGYFVDRFTNIGFIQRLGIFPSYAPKSEELALYGHNFGETITYLQNPAQYFAGGGLGSCYIAEIYHDFGYLGVIGINVLYTFIFAKFDSLVGRNIWMTFCILVIIDRIFYSPRADALGCFTEFLSSTFIIFTLMMLYVKYKNSHLSHSKRSYKASFSRNNRMFI